jgi:pilus assembly protein Flp/PilA
MKRREKGQGLVEYALILVLVAIVVIAVMHLLGPIIGGVFCDINNALSISAGLTPSLLIRVGDSQTTGFFPTHRVTMDIGDDFVTIDAGEICGSHKLYGGVVTNASHGIAEHQGDGIFTYEPNDKDAGIDDSFTYSWKYTYEASFDKQGQVTITFDNVDPVVSQSNTLSSVMNATQEENQEPDLNDVQEDIFALQEETEEQAENFQEGTDLAVEALGEGLEVLTEFADDSGDLMLSASLSQLLAEVRAGNLATVQAAITQIGTGLALAPVEVWLDMSLKMAPSLTKSCVVVSEARVSSDAINGAFEAINGLDDDHPGKADALAALQVGVAAIEARNTASAEYVDIQSAILQAFVAGFEYVGEYDIAAQLAADSEACGN